MVVCENNKGFTLTVENQITNRILIPKNGQIRCVVATYPIADKNETIGKLKVLHDLDSGKHKTYQERRILKWAVLKRQNGDLELAGPTKDIILNGVVHKTKSVQVPITNLSSSYAQVNANITGDCAEMMQLTPETASIGPDGQLVFTIKYTASNPHVPRLHNLVIEVSGQQREFVFPFKVKIENHYYWLICIVIFRYQQVDNKMFEIRVHQFLDDHQNLIDPTRFSLTRSFLFLQW